MQKQKKPTIAETVITLGTFLVVLIGAMTIRYAIYLPQVLH